MTVKLGYVPNEGELVLSEGADWLCTLQEDKTVWPAGTTCRLVFPTLTNVGPFLATVDVATAKAAFVLQETDTTAAKIPARTPFRIYLKKANDFCWFRGKVVRAE